MINDQTILERDLHNFFERYPEFLTGDDHDSYWSEPSLRSADGRLVRPDFILQPGGDRTSAWNWSIVELKGHTAPLRNIVTIEHKFGGVCPRPRLIALLGRRPTCPQQRLAFTPLTQRVNGVKILSYDEVLERRRLAVGRWQTRRGRKRSRSWLVLTFTVLSGLNTAEISPHWVARSYRGSARHCVGSVCRSTVNCQPSSSHGYPS